jgi:hypothetical protein
MRQASRFGKVASVRRTQAGQFAIEQTPFVSTFRLTWPLDRVNGTKRSIFQAVLWLRGRGDAHHG